MSRRLAPDRRPDRRSAALRIVLGAALGAAAALAPLPSPAHHVLGRPSYGLTADSTTPPSTVAEARSGPYLVTFMVFPAFPEPGRPARLNVYVENEASGEPVDTEVAFAIRPAGWLASLAGSGLREVGRQRIDDGVYRQGFSVSEAGDYEAVVTFRAGGETHRASFDFAVGEPGPWSAVGLGAALLVIVAAGAALGTRRWLLVAKLRRARGDGPDRPARAR